MAKISKPEMPVEYLRSLFSYDPETGYLTHIKVGQNHKRLLGKECKTHDAYGYLKVQIDKMFYPSHRVIWAHYYGVWPPMEIDHINGAKDDNRLVNLRLATRKENGRNRKTSGATKSKRGKWVAQISKDKKRKHLGSFDTREEAEAAYAAASLELFGEFCRAWKNPADKPATPPESKP